MYRLNLLWIALFAGATVVACGDDGTSAPLDASGATDASAVDASTRDSGLPADAAAGLDGGPDGSVPDAAIADAGPMDGAVADAGDAGLGPSMIYDFEDLGTTGFLDGRDGWSDRPGQGQATLSMDETSGNGTRVARHMPTTAFNQSAFMTRVNDDAYGFAAYRGDESDAVLQVDVHGSHLSLFALGHDVNGDGDLRGDEIGPAFGVRDQHFRIEAAAEGAATDVEFGSGNARDDWYRVQLRIDFGASSGDGVGSLAYLNLTDGETTFQPVAGLQDVPLSLTDLATEARPEAWDAMWLHLLTGGGNVAAADNLVPRAR